MEDFWDSNPDLGPELSSNQTTDVGTKFKRLGTFTNCKSGIEPGIAPQAPG